MRCIENHVNGAKNQIYVREKCLQIIICENKFLFLWPKGVCFISNVKITDGRAINLIHKTCIKRSSQVNK